MTLRFSTLNTVSTQGAGVVWLLKEMLVGACGWTVPRSGNGTTGGEGDNIASEEDLGKTNSWIVFRRPDWGAEWCFARGADTYRWNILYSKEAQFSGGTSSARATASDEKYVVNSTQYTFYGGVANVVADDAKPWGFAAYCWSSDDGSDFGGVVYDPMEVSLKGDPDPYICGSWSGYDRYRCTESGDAAESPRSKGYAGDTWGAIPGHYYSEIGGQIAFPGKAGTNPYSGSVEVPVARIHHARSSDAGTRGIWKGASTFTRWSGVLLSRRDTITVGEATWIVMGRQAELLLPWEPGVVPVGSSTGYEGEEVIRYGGGGERPSGGSGAAMFKTGMTGLIKTLGPIPAGLLKGALAGLAADWTKPGNFVYSHQPVVDSAWDVSYVFDGGGPTQIGERQYQDILLVGNRYRIRFSVSGRTAGTVVAEAGTTQGIVRDADGTYTDTLTCVGSTRLAFYKTVDFDGEVGLISVENLSVTEALVIKGVGTWADGRFVQAAAANMPFAEAETGPDGPGKGLWFDGTNDFMVWDRPTERLHSSLGFTAAFVIEPEITVATGNRVILDQTNNDPVNPGLQVVYNAANQQLTTRVANGVDWTVAGSTWLSRGIPHIVDARWSEAGGLRLSVDDHAVAVAGGVGGAGAAADLQLGRRVGGEYFAGRVSDLVVRQGEVPDRDIERWRGRMRGKLGFRHKTFLEGLEFVTTNQAQTLQILATLGSPYSIDWGDGHIDNLTGTGASVVTTHNYASPGKYLMRVIIDPSALIVLYSTNNGLCGAYPDMSTFPNLYAFGIQQSMLSGTVRDISSPGQRLFYADFNQLVGRLPSISGSDIRAYYANNNYFEGPMVDLTGSLVTHLRIDSNQLSGTIAIKSTVQVLLYCSNNKFSDYEESNVPLSTNDFQAHNNLLPQTAIDQIIADFHNNLSNRPTTGTLNLGGTGNAAPSAAGKAKAQEIQEHGWTVTVNGGLD